MVSPDFPGFRNKYGVPGFPGFRCPRISAQRPVATSSGVCAQLKALGGYMLLADEIESFWREPANPCADTWFGHRDINEVMLATSLAPEGFLVLALPDCPGPGH